MFLKVKIPHSYQHMLGSISPAPRCGIAIQVRILYKYRGSLPVGGSAPQTPLNVGLRPPAPPELGIAVPLELGIAVPLELGIAAEIVCVIGEKSYTGEKNISRAQFW